MSWRNHVVEIKDRARLIELIESGNKLISGVAKLNGIPGRFELITNLVEAQKAYREQLTEMDGKNEISFIKRTYPIGWEK